MITARAWISWLREAIDHAAQAHFSSAAAPAATGAGSKHLRRQWQRRRLGASAPNDAATLT
jgi:hypothetical protein